MEESNMKPAKVNPGESVVYETTVNVDGLNETPETWTGGV